MKIAHYFSVVLVLTFIASTSVLGQVRTTTDGRTPGDAAGGAPAGSYPLTGFDTINIFNRKLNFFLPLATLQGRGKVPVVLPLVLDKGWIGEFNEVTLQYSVRETGGGGGAGILIGEQITDPIHPTLDCTTGGYFSYLVTRFRFIDMEGTEHTFFDTAQNGARYLTPNLCTSTPANNRGRTFVTRDGTAATLILDADVIETNWPDYSTPITRSGVVILRDGTRYRIDSLGRVSFIQDANGNRVNFNYDGSTYQMTSMIDSIGRTIAILKDTPSVGIDTIRTKGFGGDNRDVKVYYANLSVALRPGSTLQTYTQLFTEISSPTGIYDPPLVSRVELPDGRSFHFYYNSYGELARVILPTGGGFDYEWAGYPSGSGYNQAGLIVVRHLTKRTTYKDLTATDDPNNPTAVNVVSKEIYSRSDVGYDRYITVETRDGNNTLIAQSKHYFYSPPQSCEPSIFTYWEEGKEYKTEKYQVTGGVLGPVLTTVEHTWSPAPRTVFNCATNNIWPDPKIVETKTTLNDLNFVSKQTYSYDALHNLTDVYEYAFGVGAPGSLIRHTHTDYVTLNNGVDYAADTNIHIRNLPLQKQVFDAGGTMRAETFYEYDNYNSDGFHSPLTDCQNISGHDSAFGAGYIMRGNATKTSRALLDNNGGVTEWVNSHAQYDIAGNVVNVIDANGNATQFDFRDNFGSPDDPEVHSSENPANNAPGELGGQMSYAFPFKITNALEHKAYTKYDYYLGKVALSEDANGVKSNVYFNDALDRPTKGVRAIGTSVASQTVFVYNDSGSPVNGHPARSVTTIGDKDVFGESDSGNGLKSVAIYDGLGRMWRGAAYEGPTWTIKDMHFDALGRVSQVSNLYRAADPGSASPPANLWTTTEYDALGRVTKLTTPDGAHVDTVYSGNQTTVTDQAGKKRRSETDAFGRLIKVIEDPGGLNYATIYLYDPLDNLRKVTQGSQSRWFGYDSLSRLIRVKNPEQNTNGSLPAYTDPVTGGSGWSMAYSYDANGNLVSNTDPRNITTNYVYDALNRNTSVDYSNTTALNPDITRVYDNTDPDAYGKGRLWRNYARGDLTNGTDTDQTVIDGYDALGRPLSVRQHFKVNGVWKPGVSFGYTTSVTYDLAGNIKTMTYPSGRSVNYSYDGAGRLSSFTGNLGDGQLRTYSTIAQYHPAGMIERETFGTQTPLHHKKRYNNRLQLGDLRLSTGSDALSYDRGALLFFYGPNAVANTDPLANDPTNNGNLVKQMHYVPLAGGGEVVPQADTYTYDALNRISGVVEPNVFTQTYGYDRWGNRQITGATGGVNNYNPTYDPGSNRIVGPSYDMAGNIISDLLTGGTMTYDAENRLLTATAGGGGTYTYDANGKRTRRTAGGQETWYVYGIGGELLAEYAADGAPSAPQKEYGYRGGQILIIAEIGSGGGTSFVKPASQSRSDLIGKIGPGAGGSANRIFSADEPFAALGLNKGYGLITADFSDSDNTGTLVRGGPRVTAEEYGNAPSSNGVGGALLAEHPAGAAPSSPQKEYGYRGGRSIVTVQSGGVVSVSPTANQSPDPGLGGVAVNSPINTGHGSTLSEAYRTSKGGVSQTKTCLWHSFSGVTGTRTRVTLKFDWTLNASINVSAFDELAGATASYDFKIEYSLDNGSTWTVGRGLNDSVSIPDGAGGSDGRSINTFGSESVDLPNPGGIDITQIRVRDRIFTSAAVRVSNNGSASSNATASVSSISLEVELLDSTAPVITGVSSSAVTHNSATISWTTNEPADSQVEYGTTTAYGQSTALDPALVTAHSQGLSGLTPGMPYHYRVKSRDATGNLAISDDFTFTTSSVDTKIGR